ncbi:MAG TPA: phosphatase PAP2 family protein [Verrucomicrobiae bacterium]|nr:phosphatase PAP2 family protein [Verrucomicrobiae bacterium]
MQPIDRLVQLVVSAFLIVGVYQFYFWCQRNYVTPPREFRLPIDDRIPYRPRWVWIYSFLYYPVIVAINWTVTSPRQFLYVAISYMLLLGFQMAFFIFLPVMTPAEWRAGVTSRGHSERFLAFVQSFDGRSNSFPSMHTSVATLTALHLYPSFGPVVVAFPVLIALSCLFTKQHYVVDLPAGALLGWLAFKLFQIIY